MDGSERVRFCRACRQQVLDVQGLPEAEAQTLATWATGERVDTLYERRDGTTLTRDCPRGLKVLPIRERGARSQRWAAWTALVGSAFALAAAGLELLG